jgi:hypothetical protein
MITLMKETEYVSLSSRNYIRTYNQKIAIIDTESSFNIKKLVPRGFMRLIGTLHVLKRDYTKEALQYLLVAMAQELKKYEKGREYRRILQEAKHHLAGTHCSKMDCTKFFEQALKNE